MSIRNMVKGALIFSAFLLGGVFIAKTAQAGLWEQLSTMDQPVKQPTAEYAVEAAGWNLRVYEWVPQDNTNVRCVFAAGSKKGGVSCYPVNQGEVK